MFGQRFAADGSPVGPEFRINEVEDGDQFYPSLAMLPDGGFVATFHTSPEDGRDFEVMGRRFNADGEGEAEFQLNTHTESLQKLVRVAVLPTGFVAVWESYGQDGDGYGVYQRRFDDVAGPDAVEQSVPDSGQGWQYAPAVASSPDRYVVAWHESTPEGTFVLRTRVFPVAASPAP